MQTLVEVVAHQFWVGMGFLDLLVVVLLKLEEPMAVAVAVADMD